MKTSSYAIISLILYTFLSLGSSASAHQKLLHCLQSDPSFPVYTPNTTSYTSVLQFSIRNPRFNLSTTPKPLLIVTPLNEAHVQAAVICSGKYGLYIRTRSGGHDYDGVSYTSGSHHDVPFVIVDLINLASISVDAEDGTAWVQSGATIGQLYYRIAEKSRTYGFPAGFCPTVGIGGHFSGGGYGMLTRKYGLAADNVIDALLVNVEGKILNRKSMGEDIFWAIRGGGAASFGIVLSWKINLVPVPPTVTVFILDKTVEDDATALYEKWQSVAPKLTEDLFIRIIVDVVNSSKSGERTIQASFHGVYLGEAANLMPIMDQKFPELRLKRENCIEISWIQAVLFMTGIPIDSPLQVLLNRTPENLVAYKTKSDYFTDPISKTGLEGIWKLFLEENRPQMLVLPYGGRMSEISESATPFPHRKGNLYMISPFTFWEERTTEAAREHIGWIRRLHTYLTPYVSKSPRSAYLNNRDLDLGQSKNGTTSYLKAKATWGIKYFKNNFNRLVRVKSQADPDNFFRNEQSIPTWKKED